MTLKRFLAVARGVATNIVAYASPQAFLALTGETGRGRREYDEGQLRTYCRTVFDDYRRMCEAVGKGGEGWLEGKVVLEYGPGDFLGVPILFLGAGARRVYCIDRFPLGDTGRYRSLYREMLRESGRGAAEGGDPVRESAGGLVYVAASDGIYQPDEEVDLIVSRAVLEHCNELDRTFESMSQSLREGGLMIHKVDFTSHGTHIQENMDFLVYSPTTWRLMTSSKGYPNRHRRDRYRELLEKHGFRIEHEESLYEYTRGEVESIRQRLDKSFRDVPDEDLMCTDYFFVARKLGRKEMAQGAGAAS